MKDRKLKLRSSVLGSVAGHGFYEEAHTGVSGAWGVSAGAQFILGAG